MVLQGPFYLSYDRLLARPGRIHRKPRVVHVHLRLFGDLPSRDHVHMVASRKVSSISGLPFAQTCSLSALRLDFGQYESIPRMGSKRISKYISLITAVGIVFFGFSWVILLRGCGIGESS